MRKAPMSEEQEDHPTDDQSPQIVGSEEREIPEREPPNDRVIDYQIPSRDDRDPTSEDADLPP